MPNVGRQYAQKQQAAKKKKKKPGAIKSFLQKRKHKKTMKKLGFAPDKKFVKETKKADRKKKYKFELTGRPKTKTYREKHVGVEKTEGGKYPTYKKGGKAAGSFKSTFASKCKDGASGFTWQGRKYSCARKDDAPKSASKKPVKKRTNTGLSERNRPAM